MAWGERDLNFEEVQRMGTRLFGVNASLYVDFETRTFVVARFLDGLGPNPTRVDHTTGAIQEVRPAQRPERIYGRGRTWTEAFEKAALTIHGITA